MIQVTTRPGAREAKEKFYKRMEEHEQHAASRRLMS